MPDSEVDQPSTEAGLERLHDAVNKLSDLVRDAARKSVALETRIEALPGPKDIAVAVEAELERTVRDARDAIDARVGQLAGDIDTLERRLVEIGDALVPLEGLRTEIATVADQSSSFSEIRASIADAVSRIGSASSPQGERAAGVDTDELLAGVRGALDSTVATIRADFEVLVRAEQQEAEKRIDALGLRITNLSMSVSKALDDLVGHSARIDDRAHLIEGENAAILEAVRKEVAAAVTAAREEVRVRTESLGDALSARAASIESSLTERVAKFEAGLAERIVALQSSLAEQLQALTAGVGALPKDMSTTLAEINRTISAVGDLSSVQTAIEAAAERLRAEQTRALEEINSGQAQVLEQAGAAQARALDQIAERIGDVAPSVARALADVREALSASSTRAAGEVASLREEIGSAAQRTADELTAATQRTAEELAAANQRTAGVLDELRAPLLQMAEAAGGIERSREELSAAIAALSEHIVQRTAGVKTSITDRAARLETQIAALPGADDLASAIEQRLQQSMSEAQRKANETSDAVRHDLNGIASNVNEIWMRVRTMGKGLEEVRAAAKEDAATLIAMIEEMAQSEERSAARLAEAERRFVGAVRQIEHERDRVFIETMNEFLDELPRRERKRVGKRLRALSFARRAKEASESQPDVEPLAPQAPVSAAEPVEEHPIPVEQPRTPAPKATPRKKAQPRSRAPKKAVEKPVKKQARAPLRAVETPRQPKPRKRNAPKPEPRPDETSPETVEPTTITRQIPEATETVPEPPIEPDQRP